MKSRRRNAAPDQACRQPALRAGRSFPSHSRAARARPPRRMTTILGILNITEDSFSDGAKYLDPVAAIAHGRALVADGADVLDLGAASSNPESKGVPPDIEIGRLTPVIAALTDVALSIDSYSLPVQRWALAQNVAYINDIHGFADASLYPELAASEAKLVVMHCVQEEGAATRVDVPPSVIMDRIAGFFETRLGVLEKACDRSEEQTSE